MGNGASLSFWAPIRDGIANTFSLSHERRLLVAALLTSIAYYVGSLVGFTLTFSPHPVSVLWPPNSILLAALLLTPARAWIVIVLAALPAHIISQVQSGVPLPMMMCYFLSNAFEAILGAGCVRYFIRGPVRFDSLRNTTIFCLFAALAGPFLSSFLDAGFVRLNHWGEGDYWVIWRIRFFSNMLTALTLAPAILIWLVRPVRRRKEESRHWLETSLLFLTLLGVCSWALYVQAPPADPALFCVPVPLLLWAALRFGARGTITAIFLVALLAIWSSAHGHGPFTAESPEENARAIQLFLIVMAIPFLFLSAGIAERRTAEERFRKAFHANPDAASIARLSDGMLVDVNERWLSMFGYSRSDVIGQTVYDLGLYVSVDDRAQMIVRIERDESVRDFECSLRRKDGRLLRILFSAELVETAGDTCTIAIARDITDLKRAEEADRNLAHASRLAVVGELTASIAHEINQPLGAILSNADAAAMLLESDSPPLDELRNIVADIHADDMRASETIRHLRRLTSKHEMQVEPLDLNEVALEVLRLVATEARRRNVSLISELADAPAAIVGDRVHLQQVLMNLILNGLEAMTDTPPANRRLLVRSRRTSEGKVQVSVTDSGRGVGEEQMPRIFESFYTTRKNGMGLGLAIARSIVDAHRGKIYVENNREGGAVFRVDLPAAAENGELP